MRAQRFAALHRVRRRYAGHHLIERSAERIDVRGGPLHAVAAVLLLGRIAVLDDDRHALAAVVYGMTRRAEIDQPHAAVFEQHNVVGRDIPVDHAAVVDVL